MSIQTSSQGPGPAQPKNPPITMHIVPRDDNGTIEWDLDSNNSPAPGKKRPVLLEHDSGEHEIVYHLQTAPGLKFDFDTSNPIDTEDDVPCPPASGLNSDQIEVVSCSKNKLVIRDKNEGDARLVRYQLNFVSSDGGSSPPACDPVILNGGGTKTVR